MLFAVPHNTILQRSVQEVIRGQIEQSFQDGGKVMNAERCVMKKLKKVTITYKKNSNKYCVN